MCGCLLAYWLGYKFGKKAVKWCAGSDEDYDKWSNYLNKKGKVWYLLTVLFPFFPDDLLCLVAGAVKFDFAWYTLANFIGRGIGLTTMIFFLLFIGNIGGDFPVMLIVWLIILVTEIVIHYVLKSKQKKELKETVSKKIETLVNNETKKVKKSNAKSNKKTNLAKSKS